MTTQATIQRWFEHAKGDYFNLYFAGLVFGGRPGESPQKVMSIQLTDPVLVVRFGSTERLTVTDPKGVKIVAANSLIIAEASDARFGWHYYGKPQLPENWCELIYRRQNSSVQVICLGPLSSGTEEFSYDGKAFVEIHKAGP